MSDEGGYSPDFSFNPTPTMSPDRFMGFVASMTPEQLHMVQTYWHSPVPSTANPTPIPSAGPSQIPSPLVTPPTTQPSTPRESQRLDRRSRRRSTRGSSSGGGCCGSGGTDASTPPRERPTLSSVGSTPLASPRTPWGAHSHDDRMTYHARDGAVVMDSIGKELKARLRQMCQIQFGHSIMIKWDNQDQEKKNYIISAIQDEFRPADPTETVSSQWIMHVCKSIMSHRRSEARDAFKEGKPKPTWLDAEEWQMIIEENQATPDRYRQQQEAARARLQAVGASHLGSGGFDTFRTEFVSNISLSLIYLTGILILKVIYII